MSELSLFTCYRKGLKVMPKQQVFCMQLKGRQRFLRLLGSSAKTRGLCCGLVTLKPQELIGEHKTEGKEEVLIILKGRATVYSGKNKILQASRNTFVFIPAETLHNVRNSGNKILQYLYVTSRV
jgi:mannose-6-phosphate isomerase-like protein (cupin superfamily)